MGIAPNTLSFLLAGRAAGVDLRRTMTLGRQNLLGIDREVARESLAQFGIHLSEDDAAGGLSALFG